MPVRIVTTSRRLPRLSTQLLLLELAIILLTVGVSSVVVYLHSRGDIAKRAGAESLAIAQTVATDQQVIAAITRPDGARIIDPIAERIRRATGASFVVVANRRGIRMSHPNPKLIGKSLLHDPGENPRAIFAGGTFVGEQRGSLGWSMRAKVPIRDANGRVVGLVSVGVLEKAIASEFRESLPVILVPLLVALTVAVLGAFLLARRVKRQTFGLEPDEIAALLEQREAMLHGVREGAITLDPTGRITLINDQAQRLLGLTADVVGQPVGDVVPTGRVQDVLLGRASGRDEVLVLGERVLVANRMPVEVRGRPIGAVVTLRDRTELDALSRELHDVRKLADALRAQEHEFQHRLHVISGLIELGRYDDAVQEINRSSLLHQELAASLVDRVGDPILAALLLGKAAVASEHGVKLDVHATELPHELEDVRSLVAMLGNLIDNALESASDGGGGGHVDVVLRVEGAELVIAVHDSGPGVDPALTEEIFRDGFTTKVARGGQQKRGLGLALVSQEVHRRRGTIEVENVDGARFTVRMPLRSLEEIPS
ncbi:MAG: sensor histidine kinase [Acidobacteriota bacterium]|nr:sensor histidine kinase [Acidobacteriota bacterium]